MVSTTTWTTALGTVIRLAPAQVCPVQQMVVHLRCVVRELVRQGLATLVVDVLTGLSSSCRANSAARHALAPLCDEAHCLVSRVAVLCDRIVPFCSDDYLAFLSSTFAIIGVAAEQPKSGEKPVSVASFESIADELRKGNVAGLTMEDVKRHAQRVLMRLGPTSAQHALEPLVSMNGCAEELVALHRHYGVLATHLTP
jgi:hypothetical protein